MAYIPGYAGQPDFREVMLRRAARHAEISHLTDTIDIQQTSRHGRTEYTGTLPDEPLSDIDLVLLCDNGQGAPLGGLVTRAKDRFAVTIYQD